MASSVFLSACLFAVLACGGGENITESDGQQAAIDGHRARLAIGLFQLCKKNECAYYPELNTYSEAEGARYRSRGARVVWSMQNRFVGCLMPKIGTSTWLHYLRTMLLPADTHSKIIANREAWKLTSYDEYGLHFRGSRVEELQTYSTLMREQQRFFKWAIVRHPWGRLVSAYRSKYEGVCNQSRSCLRSKYFIPVPDRPEMGDTNVTFHEMVAALASMPPEAMDAHFRPATLLCEFDRAHYNFIGELGNAEHMDTIARYSNFNRSYSEVEGRRAAAMYDPNIYFNGRTSLVQPCNAHTVELAMQVYGQDAALLGYTFDDAMRSCSEHGVTSPPNEAS